MRSLILILSLALALPMVPTMASADAHSCNQLRQGVVNRAPTNARNLPYAALRCSAISELHLLLNRANSYSNSYLTQRIEAVFRREGLIR
ncbi:hypothetical protein [Jannaschia sp. CCS1]|uniref:hypothetical protein n=1 Tax=Jannaschia sp. (strain CCS1) TaxID=290400 RepID=UPI000053B730|nr:hypothetical protein [Jannaschia sp. CCS1]ABD53474.1 hypothetical protein Jann_0557 [Jannaschia sp. CCS1]